MPDVQEDPDTTPPVLCEREDCLNPSNCVCAPEDACHHALRERFAKEPRNDE